MIHKILVILISLILFINIAHGEEQNKARGITLIESSANSVTIQFQPQLWIQDSISVQSKTYLKLDFFGATYESEPGEPLTPIMIANIGIPLDAKVNPTIIESQYHQITGRLLPRPELINKNKIDLYQYFENSSIYASNADYPNRLIEIEEPAFFRDQQVVTVKFYPVQFNPVLNKMTIYQTVVVKIDFQGASQSRSPIEMRPDENKIYKGVILNYEQAKHWRKSPTVSLKKTRSFQDNNPWFKISIKDEGMYKITGNMLVSFGIDIKSINPGTVKIYNNGGRELPRNIKEAFADSLVENAIIVNDGGDGIFDLSDYIIFYGKAVNNWFYNSETGRFEHYLNHYGDQNVYWLTWGGDRKGKRMENLVSAKNVSVEPEPQFLSPYYFEQEIHNFLDSGLNWFTRFFNAGDQYTLTANLPNVIPGNTFFKFSFLGWSSGRHTFTISVNNQKIGEFSSNGSVPFEGEKIITGAIKPGYNNITIKYNNNLGNGQAYLDWFEIHYPREYEAIDNHLEFYLYPKETVRKYTIKNFSNNEIELFDVTDFFDAKLFINTTISDNQITAVDANISIEAKKLIALSAAAYKVPEGIERVELSDLRRSTIGADFVIIAHHEFYNEIQRLARHREIRDSLKTVVIEISDIYNEFSWGLYDPTAIRNFIKYAYENWAIKPSYVLLCGDGDYDYKNLVNDQDKNWIPPYETTELDEHSSRATEDWFVMVSGNDNFADLAIGRLPVRSVEETKIIVDKIINYETAPLFDESGIDDWRNIITIVGDDELTQGGVGNETIHTSDAENIIEYYISNKFNKKKIYLSEYPAVRNASYFSTLLKPTATEAILKQINQGTLILDYVGHGNPSTWSHEYVLYSPRDFERIQNGSRLALWIAATCDFGRFDHPAEQSLAEDLLITGGRGAIAVLASSREAYASNNAALNRAFFLRLFNQEGRTERLGFALLKAKLDNRATINDQKYLLLGDPTMRLAVPQYAAKITSIRPDTIQALSRVTVSGYVESGSSDFNGKILLKAFDSKKKRVYSTEQGSKLNYTLEGNTIFRGIHSIENGKFEMSFIVPKDITYGGNLGRISLYFANSETHGYGYRDSLYVGGTSEIIDTEGPKIVVGLQNQDFLNNGFVNTSSILKIDISDSISGINITGDIGHNISMIIDDNRDNKINLTDLFQYNEGSFTNGRILYNLSDYQSPDAIQNENGIQQGGLPAGPHTIEIKAWDNSNNSSIARADFVVVSSSDFALKDVLNYPNPFSTRTTFTFWASHDCEATIKIFTVAGRLLYKFDETFLAANQLAQFEWDGRDEEGDGIANGVYFYKVIAKAHIDGKIKTKEAIEKLVIMR